MLSTALTCDFLDIIEGLEPDPFQHIRQSRLNFYVLQAMVYIRHICDDPCSYKGYLYYVCVSFHGSCWKSQCMRICSLFSIQWPCILWLQVIWWILLTCQSAAWQRSH